MKDIHKIHKKNNPVGRTLDLLSLYASFHVPPSQQSWALWHLLPGSTSLLVADSDTMSECSDFILKDHHHPLILGVWPQMDDYYIIITVLLPDFLSSRNP